MKKYSIYIIVLAVGLVLGWLIFSKPEGNAVNLSTHTSDDKSANLHIKESAHSTMWTCSMHPQIMLSEPGDCPICGMNLIPASSSADGLAMNEIKMTKNAMALANISTSIVGKETLENGDMISLSGKIKRNEEENAIQASYFDGRIERLHVNYEGQEVRKGQLLATIYAPSLVAAQQELITAASVKKSQPSLYKAVRNKLKLWKLSESQINSIEKSGKVRENFPIYATVSGTVSEKMAVEGDYVKQGQPIVKVSNLNSVWAEFDAYENQISEFRKGQKILVTTSAYPNKEFEATVSFIDPILNTQTRTVTVRADLKNNKGIFKPGMFVTGKVENKSNNSEIPISIPASAVMWTGKRSLVYLKTNPKEPVFKMQEVTLGNRNGETFTILSGLQDGDEIVTNGTFTVDAAAQLQGKKSMMNAGAKASEVNEMPMSLSESFQRDFKALLPDYLRLKDAFVSSDTTKISATAEQLISGFKKIDLSTLKDMEQSHMNTMLKDLQDIVKSNDVVQQRSDFVELNENMIAIAKNLQDLPQELYIQKCPMAANNRGAQWLSADKIIKNPYYGNAMESCGSVIDSIK